jgi:hypothetical protein
MKKKKDLIYSDWEQYRIKVEEGRTFNIKHTKQFFH